MLPKSTDGKERLPVDGYTLIECQTVKEFWEILSPENQRWSGLGPVVYRGQANAQWGLVPSVLRESSLVRKMIPGFLLKTDLQLFGEMQLLRFFSDYCDSMGLRIPGDSIKLRQSLDTNTRYGDVFLRHPSRWPTENAIYLMALAQHHKLHTRLLDWTQRSYVAAYFAAAEAMRTDCGWKEKENAALAVWALNIHGMLGMSPDDDGPMGSLYPNITIVRAPGAVSPNLAAQGGLFTLLRERGNAKGEVLSRTLEDEFKGMPKSPLVKIALKAAHAPDIMELCKKYSVNAATLFPGYDGAALAVSEAIACMPSMPA